MKVILVSKMLFGQQAAKIAQNIFINNLLTAFCCCDNHQHFGKIHRNRMPDRQKIPDNGMEDGASAAPNNKAGSNYCCAGPE